MSPPWMPLYVADYLADTGHLGALESGGYLHLIMHYWQHGGLPKDDRQLARVARMTDREWSKCRAVIAAFFVEGWRHTRIETELAKSSEKNERRVAAGKAGGYGKHKRSKPSSNATSNDPANALASSSQPQSEDTSLRSVSAREARKPKPKSVRTQIAEDAQPTPADRDHATTIGMSAEVFRFEWSRFRDHHLKVASTFASWPAAWRTWCANWLERGGSRNARAGPGNRSGGRTVAEMAAMNLDEPDIFDDPRADHGHRATEGTERPDQGRSGFAGRLSVPAADDARRRAFIDH